MRLVICDQHVIFAESLARLLVLRGDEVVAVTHRFADAIAVVEQECPDICVIDAHFGDTADGAGLTALCRAAPGTAIVLLSGRIDRDLQAAAVAAGVRALAEKRESLVEIWNVLDRVHAGESIVDRARGGSASGDRMRTENDSQRLAAFLTPRERQVLSALVRGDDTAKLARALGVSATTARSHIQSVLTKMGAHSRLEVATTAVRAGMVSPKTGEWLSNITS